MKLNKHILSSCLMASVLVFSCTEDFESINENPNAPFEVPAQLLIPALVEGTMDMSYSAFNGGDMGSAWAQHWSKVQYNDEERYRPRDTQFDAIWNQLYAGTIQDARMMRPLAQAQGNTNLEGIAIVMEVYAFSILTDVFGDVPYSQALKAKEGINTPEYDRQEDIYPSLLAKLDEANALFKADGGTITATSDILYAGDWEKWKKFANSLKFRLLMRMATRADFNRQAELQALVTNAGGATPMFESNADEAKLVYLAAAPNNNPVNATIVAGNRGEFKVNSVIVDMLDAADDPRLAVYAQVNNNGDYRGKPSGIIDVPSDEWSYLNVSPIGTLYLAATAPAYLMSYPQLELLIAEAAKRGLISGGDAEAAAHFNAGVTASMAANGVAATGATWLADHPYNPVGGLAQIQTQEWIALFGQGIEAWTEWRRTGVPALTPAIEGVINEIPSRYSYPPTEQALNGASYAKAVEVQGPDLLTTPVWWMR